MNRFWIGSALASVILSGPTALAASLDFIGDNIYGTAISADGTIVVGNTQGEYETFRWAEASGVVPLGRATVPVLGRGAGTPAVSADGLSVTGTILGADSTYITQGMWTARTLRGSDNWQETMPPTPPDGGLLDLAYGSAWGISDDGTTLVGLYWRPNDAETGSAHPSRWTAATGVVDLGTSGGSGRANDANIDGSIIVGWEENPNFGNWWPTVWVHGVRSNLSTADVFAEATCVNPAGTVIGGHSLDEATGFIAGALWRWDGDGYVEESIGMLPGHSQNFGLTTANDMTPDASIVVGYDRRSNPGDATGFVWTEEDGIISANEFLAANGLSAPSGFVVRSFTGISEDGLTILGTGENTFPPFASRTFLIRLDPSVDAPSVPLASTTSSLRVFPNPTHGAATISLEMPRSSAVDLAVYDSAGRLVRRLLDNELVAAGRRNVNWDGHDRHGSRVAPGVYYLKSQAQDYEAAQRVVVVR